MSLADHRLLRPALCHFAFVDDHSEHLPLHHGRCIVAGLLDTRLGPMEDQLGLSPAGLGESLGLRLLLLELRLYVLRAYRANHARHHDRGPLNSLITAVDLGSLGLGADGHCKSVVGSAYQSPLPDFLSLKKGDALRSGVYVIVEDVVPVDSKQGRAWRQAWNDRYLSSTLFQHFSSQMERMWAATGLSIVAVIWGVVFGLENHEIAYTLRWALPFAWGAGMALITIVLAKRMLRQEEAVRLGQCPTRIPESSRA